MTGLKHSIVTMLKMAKIYRQITSSNNSIHSEKQRQVTASHAVPSIATGERSSWNSGLCGPWLSVTVLQGLPVELLRLLCGGVKHSSIAATSSCVMLVSCITVSRLLTSEIYNTYLKVKKGKVRVLVIVLLTTRPAALLQSQKWQLIGMS